ncbi:MAG: SMI1/KNR4 family protein [Chloroflexaceae bacterium]|nr:SMI1/KNR4 family protein [Chloroflexaceae bacterium]
MIQPDIAQLIDSIPTLSVADDSMPLYSAVLPPVPWDLAGVEQTLAVTLPPDVISLWEYVGTVRLFEDTTYGQWGLILWSPEQIMQNHPAELAWYPDDVRPGDLIIGEFLGDSERLLVRCDISQPDYGSIMVVLPLDPRSDWYTISNSLGNFLQEFIAHSGQKFWE